MKRFSEGADLKQATLFPGQLDDYVGDDSLARVIDALVHVVNLSTALTLLKPPGLRNSFEAIACAAVACGVHLCMPTA